MGCDVQDGSAGPYLEDAAESRSMKRLMLSPQNAIFPARTSG